MGEIGRFVLLVGIVLVVIGGLLIAFPKIAGIFGRLPGDFRYETDQLTCLIPLGTSILLSVFLTFILSLLARLNR